jgi:HSP20 family protein
VHRRQPDVAADRRVYRSEIGYGVFSRTLSLPIDVKPDEVHATYTDGILIIRWPLADERADATRIPVRRG